MLSAVKIKEEPLDDDEEIEDLQEVLLKQQINRKYIVVLIFRLIKIRVNIHLL